MALVDVFVNVLDSLDRSTDFKIDMTVEFGREVWVIRNDITVVKDMAPGIGVGATIVGPSIFGITIIAKFSLFTKLLWKTLAALSINHARCIIVPSTARTM
jgi:hypothetical protein